jgi:uncharacterized protein
MSDLLGAGWAFPVDVDVHGRIGLARREHDVEQAIMMILLTAKGQRVMRPEFGCRIHELIFAPNNATTVGMITYYVEDALGMWEPRINVLDVEVQSDDHASERLLITISYEIKTTLDQRTLVFPFYRIPGEGTPVAGEPSGAI